MTSVGYNERSWGIDVISNANSILDGQSRPIARAGGEISLKAPNGRTIFPDVVLFGDHDGFHIRQGWELKFPDTPIDDHDLIKSAMEKATRIGVDSFLIWNVNEARMFIRDSHNKTGFRLKKEWGPLGIRSRKMVRSEKAKWLELLRKIIDDLNDFFEANSFSPLTLDKSFSDHLFADIIERYAPLAGRSIKDISNKNAQQDAMISRWWREKSVDYGEKPSQSINFDILANIHITGWLNRFLFCHLLKKTHSKAKKNRVH